MFTSNRHCTTLLMLKLTVQAFCLLLLWTACSESQSVAKSLRPSKTTAISVMTSKRMASRQPTAKDALEVPRTVLPTTLTQSARAVTRTRSSIAATVSQMARTATRITKTATTRTSAVLADYILPNMTTTDAISTSGNDAIDTKKLVETNISLPSYVYPNEPFVISCYWSGAAVKQVEVVNEDNRTMLRCTLNDQKATVSDYLDFNSALLVEQSKASCSASIGLPQASVSFFLSLGPTSTLRDSFYGCAFTSERLYDMSQKKLLLIYVVPMVVAAMNDARDGYNASGYCYGLGKPPPSFNVTSSCPTCSFLNSLTASPPSSDPDPRDLGGNVQWFFLEAPYLWDASYVKCVVSNHPRRVKTSIVRVSILEPSLASIIPRTVDAGKVFSMSCTAKNVYVTRVQIINEQGMPVLSCYVNKTSSSVSGSGGFQPPLLDVDRSMTSCSTAGGRPPTVKVTFFLVASMSATQDGVYKCAIQYWNGSFVSTTADDSPGYPLVITVATFGMKIFPSPASFALGSTSIIGCVAYAKPPVSLALTMSSPTRSMYRTSSGVAAAPNSPLYLPLGATYVNMSFVMTQDWSGAVVRCSAGTSFISATIITQKSATILPVAGAAEGTSSKASVLHTAAFFTRTATALSLVSGWIATF